MRKPLGAVICVALLVGAAEAKTRTWTDGSGQQVRAEFVRVHDGEAVLSSAGKTLLVPLRNLSPQDQAWIQAELAKKEVRGWRRTDGQELRGKYLGYDDGQVRIRAGGTTVPVPLAELSRPDQEFVRGLLAAEGIEIDLPEPAATDDTPAGGGRAATARDAATEDTDASVGKSRREEFGSPVRADDPRFAVQVPSPPSTERQSGPRVWTDTRQRQIEAELVRIEESQVVLRKDGVELQIPLDMLSPADRAFVEAGRSADVARLQLERLSRERQAARTGEQQLAQIQQEAEARRAASRARIDEQMRRSRERMMQGIPGLPGAEDGHARADRLLAEQRQRMEEQRAETDRIFREQRERSEARSAAIQRQMRERLGPRSPGLPGAEDGRSRTDRLLAEQRQRMEERRAETERYFEEQRQRSEARNAEMERRREEMRSSIPGTGDAHDRRQRGVEERAPRPRTPEGLMARHSRDVAEIQSRIEKINARRERPTPAPPGDEIEWQHGPTTVQIGSLAQIHVPAGYQFTAAEGTQRIMELLENPVDGSELGMLMPSSETEDWFIVFEFSEIGYVPDDDRDDLDAEAILESIRRGSEAGNEERRKRGWAAIVIQGWEAPPHYDRVTNNLEWAIRATSEGEPVVNYNTRLLGRSGVMAANLVVEPQRLQAALPTAKRLLSGYSYLAGHQYGDFREGDMVAQYGLSALVAGGVATAALKSGLLQKLWKLLVVGVIAIGAFFKNIVNKLTGSGRGETRFDT